MWSRSVPRSLPGIRRTGLCGSKTPAGGSPRVSMDACAGASRDASPCPTSDTVRDRDRPESFAWVHPCVLRECLHTACDRQAGHFASLFGGRTQLVCGSRERGCCCTSLVAIDTWREQCLADRQIDFERRECAMRDRNARGGVGRGSSLLSLRR